MGGMSLFHWLIIILVVLIVFGPSRLPNLGKSLGEAIRGFKKGLDEGTDSTKYEEEARRSSHPPERLESSAQMAARESQAETKKATKEEA